MINAGDLRGAEKMPESKEPSCWRAAGFAFAIVACLVLAVGMVVGGDATATAVALR